MVKKPKKKNMDPSDISKDLQQLQGRLRRRNSALKKLNALIFERFNEQEFDNKSF